MTRIKICGLTRGEDVDMAVAAGADAIGFVFYPPSPRYVAPEVAAALVARLPPFVTAVGLFVNPAPKEVEAVLERVPLGLLQFHGEETEALCRSFYRPYLKAARVRPELDLVQYAAAYPSAQGILLDAFVQGYGGGGKTFDWTLVPAQLGKPLVLSGGLDPDNVGQALARLKPQAVDVSSGVEQAKGIKDRTKIQAFVAAVRAADRAAGPDGD